MQWWIIGVNSNDALSHFSQIWVQVSQAEVKNFFESACGEVRPENHCFMIYVGSYLCHKFSFTLPFYFTGYAPEALGGPRAFNSNCFCGICNGKSLTILVAINWLHIVYENNCITNNLFNLCWLFYGFYVVPFTFVLGNCNSSIIFILCILSPMSFPMDNFFQAMHQYLC